MFIQEWMDAWVVIAFFGAASEPAAALKNKRELHLDGEFWEQSSRL